MFKEFKNIFTSPDSNLRTMIKEKYKLPMGNLSKDLLLTIGSKEIPAESVEDEKI